MRLRAALAAASLTVALWPTPAAASGTWSSSVNFTNQVANQVVTGGGYPVPAGSTAPTPGTCRQGTYNANRSESWVAVKPGTEDLVGTSKIFFEKYSTFYDFHLGGHTFPGGIYERSSMVTGYECISMGTQSMPPSWTNNTDPNAAFDTQGRVYQVTLPFNAFWTNLHPNSNIGIVYSDDLGRTWHLGNGGRPLENAPNWSSLSHGFVEDKQWVAVNHIKYNKYQDHVYAAWAVYNGQTTKIHLAVSGDRAQSFGKQVTVTRPAESGVTWSAPMQVNDPDANDQFQPSIAAGPDGAVAIAFYDRRLTCPADASVGAGHAGKANLCIDTTLQAFKDSGAGAVATSDNVRISKYSWDPTEPLQTIDGLPQVACAGHRTPCNRGFIGDYFGLAISAGNVYAFFVSTHYPSGVAAEGGGFVYYQQQVLSTVSRSALGIS